MNFFQLRRTQKFFLTIDRATLRYARMWKTSKEMYGLYLQFLSVFFTHWLRRIVFFPLYVSADDCLLWLNIRARCLEIGPI